MRTSKARFERRSTKLHRSKGASMNDRSEPAISVSGVHKKFGATTALSRLAFEIPKGSVCGLVGPNGAGKTTTISLLLGLIAPSAGKIRVLGLDPKKDGFLLRQRI